MLSCYTWQKLRKLENVIIRIDLRVAPRSFSAFAFILFKLSIRSAISATETFQAIHS